MGKVKEINIDLDKKCTKCGAEGSFKSGLCFDCAADAWDNHLKMVIKPAIIGEAARELTSKMLDRVRVIDKIYQRDLAADLSLKVKLRPYKGAISVETELSFVTDRVKDNSSKLIDPNQLKLFEGEE